MIIIITLFAIGLWLFIWLRIVRRLKQQAKQQKTRMPQDIWCNFFWLTALVIHAFSLVAIIADTNPHSLHFTATASLVMWLSALILFIAQLKRPLISLGLFVIPLATLALAIQLIPVDSGQSIPLHNSKGLHIISSLLAFSLLTLAALQALLLALQHKHLHNHQPGGLIKTLPPLMDMEAMLFQLIGSGIFLLSIGLLTGFLYMDSLFGQHIAHKTLLSILAWGIFSTLLFGRWRYGWRGKTAVRWTLIGTSLLSIGFLGSKFILEYLV